MQDKLTYGKRQTQVLADHHHSCKFLLAFKLALEIRKCVDQDLLEYAKKGANTLKESFSIVLKRFKEMLLSHTVHFFLLEFLRQ